MSKILRLARCSVFIFVVLGCSDETSGESEAGMAKSSMAKPSMAKSNDAVSAMSATPAMSTAGAAATAMAGAAKSGATTSAANTAMDERGEAGLHWKDGSLVFRTEPYTLTGGQERYLCWAITTTEAVKVNTIDFPGARGVHHLTFAQTVTPEPEGFSECATLLKPTWRPLFSAGAGANKLTLPSGTAHELKAGTQLVIQLHLFNADSEDLENAVKLTMGVTEAADTQPVQIGGFGSMVISLPPGQTSTVTHECNLPASSRVVALMPHMHQMATSMKLELGASADDAQVIYSRDSWSFDQQTIDNIDMNLTQGQYARVTCTYNNTTDRTIKYGESSNDEMCFLGAFWIGTPINCVKFR